jgi:hypothetical protein
VNGVRQRIAYPAHHARKVFIGFPITNNLSLNVRVECHENDSFSGGIVSVECLGAGSRRWGWWTGVRAGYSCHNLKKPFVTKLARLPHCQSGFPDRDSTTPSVTPHAPAAVWRTKGEYCAMLFRWTKVASACC